MTDHMNQLYKNTMSEFTASDELKKAVLSAGKQKKRTKSYHAAAAAAVVIGVLFISNIAAFACTGETWIETAYVTFFDGSKNVKVEYAENLPIKSIPESAAIADADVEKSEYTYESSLKNIENLLGFKFLDCPEAYSDTVSYGYYRNESNNDIARVDIYRGDFVKYDENSCIAMNMCVLNEGADEGYINAVTENVNPLAGVEYLDKYISGNLNTTVVFSKSPYGIDAAFVYDNVLYQIYGFGNTEKQLRDTIEYFVME